MTREQDVAVERASDDDSVLDGLPPGDLVRLSGGPGAPGMSYATR